MDLDAFRKQYTILIVDDNEENVYTLQNRLQHDGYTNLLIAKNGFEALDAIAKKQVDLVLLDIMMPEMSGFEVLAKIKDKIVAQTLRVLMISSADSLDNVAESIKLGADDFLPKPFNGQILKARIGSCIEKSWHVYQEKLLKKLVEEEKTRYLGLLNAIFPPMVVKELSETGTVKPRLLKNVAVVFADIVSFTSFAETHDPKEVVDGLQYFIDVCETTAAKYHLEKIKTIGDAFMATANMLEQIENPVLACVLWARDLIAGMGSAKSHWEVRVGIELGDVICGVIGTREYLFDIWGQCVNIASRIVSTASPNTIYASEAAWARVSNLVSGSLVGEFKLKGREGSTKLFQIDLTDANKGTLHPPKTT